MIHTLVSALSSSVLVLLSDFVLMLVFVGTLSVGAMLLLRYRDPVLRDYLLLLLFRGLMHARDTVDSYLWQECTRRTLTMATHDRDLALAARSFGAQVLGA